MLTETNIYNVKHFCREDIKLIENYEKALSDEKTWDCHHRLGVIIKTEKLIEMGLYYNRPACELIFMKHGEHRKWHNRFISQEERENRSKGAKKRYESQEERNKTSLRQKGIPKKKFKWKTPCGEIKIMDKLKAARWHPDWTLIE